MVNTVMGGGLEDEDAYLIICCLYSIFLTVRVGYPFEQLAFGGGKLLHQKLLVKIY
jgi:hypothetical protein